MMARCFLLVLKLLILSWGSSAHAAPAPDKWVYWDKANPKSTVVVDHSLWQAFLDRYLKYSEADRMYLVEYGRVKKADMGRLGEYLSSLAARDPRILNRKEQLAYWINLYNALTVNLILDYYPIKSITKLGVGWFRTGPWRDELITITGQKISLHDIEHRILRPLWDMPEVHYALNCASLGCPDLAPRVYVSAEIEEQLDKAARHFINQPKGVNFVAGRLVLSRIFDWYEDDFGGEEGVRQDLLKYAQEDIRIRLQKYNGRISYRYNWQLNEYKP